MTALNIVEIEPQPRKGVPRDGYDRPLVVPETGGKPIPHIRTTTFIDCIEDKSNLADWGKRSVLLGAAKDRSLLDAVEALDPEDPDFKKKLAALAEKAMNAAGANDRREKGTDLHELSELVDAGVPLPSSVSAADLADMAAYKMAMLDFEVEAVEQFCVVNELCVGGTYDRSLWYTGPGPLPGMYFENELLMADLKTGGSGVQYGFLKMAAQLAVYSRAKKYDHTLFPVPELTARQKPTGDPEKDWKKRLDRWRKIEVPAEEAAKAYSSIGPINQEWGVIISLPSGSGEATLHWANLTIGWRLAQEALVIRELRSIRNALIPFNSATITGAVAVGQEC